MDERLLIPAKLSAWGALRPELASLINSKYGQCLTEAYENLNVDILYRSLTHGQGHIERTILFGALIAKGEELSIEDTKLLLLCCSYHDIGRSDDSYDLQHGICSAEKLEECGIAGMFDDITLAKAAISTHAVPDERMEEFRIKHDVKDKERYYRIARCLKDADGLDRVRICDLDTNHLRHRSSKKLENLAEWVFSKYIKKTEILCFGDSNTYGYNPRTGRRYPPHMRWPNVLQRKLGDKYHVVDEGLNGRTTIYPKFGFGWKSGLYAMEAVLGSHYPTDLLIVMLGTNDCAREIGATAGEITAGLERLVSGAESFLTEQQGYRPHIIIVAPPVIESSIYDGPFYDEMDGKSLETSSAIPECYRKLAEARGWGYVNAAEGISFSKIDSEHLSGYDHHRLAGRLADYIRGMNLE